MIPPRTTPNPPDSECNDIPHFYSARVRYGQDGKPLTAVQNLPSNEFDRGPNLTVPLLLAAVAIIVPAYVALGYILWLQWGAANAPL